MDDRARTAAATREEAPDLASIVLGSARPRAERPLDVPERVPAWFEHAPARGYDARSVIVLAVVVATLAAIVGWATTVGSDAPGGADPAPVTRDSAAAQATPLGDALDVATSAAGAASSDVQAATARAATPAGANLVAGRVVATRSGTGAGLVTVSVRNAGDAPARASEVLVLADGDVMGRDVVDALAPGASARIDVALDWCPSGIVALVAVIDPGSVVREGSEQDNATTRSASFGC